MKCINEGLKSEYRAAQKAVTKALIQHVLLECEVSLCDVIMSMMTSQITGVSIVS